MVSNSDMSEAQVEITPVDGKAVELCWMKYHSSSKHLNFIITQEYDHRNNKAGADTITDVIDKIESLENRLDIISQNIQSQYEAEIDHAQSKFKIRHADSFLVLDDAHSQQKWATYFKLFVIMGICGGQIYFVTSFFSKGGRSRMAN